MIQPKVKNHQLTYADFEEIFYFLSQKEKNLISVLVENELNILLVDEIEQLTKTEKEIADYISMMIAPYVENNQLTYAEFDKIFFDLDKRQKYDITNFLACLNVELVDKKILPAKSEKIKQPLVYRSEKEIKLSNNMLIKLIQKGDRQAMQDLCVKNRKLVLKSVQKFCKKRYTGNLDEDDLEQAGMLGMMKAAEKFDLKMGTQFSTYATWWIEQSIRRAITDTGMTVRLPTHVVEQVFKVAKLDRKYYILGKNCDERIELVSEELEVSIDKIKDLYKLYDDFMALKSLDEPVGEEKETPRANLLPDKNNFAQPEEQMLKTILRQKLDEILTTLTEREKSVLTLRFGLDDGIKRTLEEVGQKFNVTRERIRQIEAKALRKLHHPSRSKKLEDFLD